MPRTLGTLFATIAQWTREGRLSTCSVRASYLELYNEQINDLLNPESTNLQLRAHAQTGVFVENLLQARRLCGMRCVVHRTLQCVLHCVVHCVLTTL